MYRCHQVFGSGGSSPIQATQITFGKRRAPLLSRRSRRAIINGQLAALRKCRSFQILTWSLPKSGSCISKLLSGSFQVSGSLNLNLLPCIGCLPRPLYGPGGPARFKFGRKPMILSLGMSAVANRKGAQPYSAAHNEIARMPSWFCNSRSCWLAFSKGVSWLEMRSCSKGKAQIPLCSGGQTNVL